MTTPSAFTSGPPELPGLIDASVWIMSTYAPPPSAWPIRLRPVALITPAVTLGSVLPSRNPYGLPIAIAHSPMMMSSELPSGATGRLLRVDLQHGEVVLLVDAEHLGRERLAVAHGDRDSRRAGHDVRVRDDRSVWVRNETRSESRTDAFTRLTPVIQSNGSTGTRSTTSV